MIFSFWWFSSTSPSQAEAPHRVAGLRQRHEMPLLVLVQRISILPPFQEDAFHLVQVVLQSVVILREHARAQRHFEHVPGELRLGSDFHAARTLEHLHVGIPAGHLDDFGHQAVAAGGDVADFVLRHRPVHLDGHDIGNDSYNTTFCCHILIFFSLFPKLLRDFHFVLQPLHKAAEQPSAPAPCRCASSAR